MLISTWVISTKLVLFYITRLQKVCTFKVLFFCNLSWYSSFFCLKSLNFLIQKFKVLKKQFNRCYSLKVSLPWTKFNKHFKNVLWFQLLILFRMTKLSHLIAFCVLIAYSSSQVHQQKSNFYFCCFPQSDLFFSSEATL